MNQKLCRLCRDGDLFCGWFVLRKPVIKRCKPPDNVDASDNFVLFFTVFSDRTMVFHQFLC
jgi:hypothetical protein